MKQGWSTAVVTAVAVAAAAAIFISAWALWSVATATTNATAPQARQYLGTTACLLTGSSGVSPGSPGARAWQAMQSASLASHVMISYLPSTGPADVPVLLNTLVSRKCGVIVATGANRDQVASAARANPGRRFILVTASTAAGPAVVPANAVVVSAADAPGRIASEVTALAGTA
jgi:basic membrane lipoprotein Med (substrate-binding protein (PBP1-ABC) superfamily)